MTTTPPLHVRLAFCLLGIRPRVEWRAWAVSAVERRWRWIIGARVGSGLTMGGLLLYVSQLWGNRREELSFVGGFVLVICLLLIPLAVALNDDEVDRRREVSRIYGTRPTGPAQLAQKATWLSFGAWWAVTDGGRRVSGPVRAGVELALLAALIVTSFWFAHERRVLDRDLDLPGDARPDST